MDLTVGNLKKILAGLDDNVVLATLEYGNENFHTFTSIKRLLVLKDISKRKEWGGQTYLTINCMGSHFTGKGNQVGLEYQQLYFDEDSFTETSTEEKETQF